MFEHNPLLQRLIRLALEEDLAAGDITTDAILGPEKEGKAVLIARSALLLAGMPVFQQVFGLVGHGLEFRDWFKEGDWVGAGKEVCTISGPLAVILKAERTALNFIQRTCGIATLTREYVERVGSSKARILDTRKTVPGHRWLDKYAVKIGGGANHRFNLSDGILIKDNHIAAAGSIQRAVELARGKCPHMVKVEVEVEDLNGVTEALEAGADIIMLDNMGLEDMKKAVEMVRGHALTEASGGITLNTVQDVARTGVDFISVGALTHSPKAADLSLEIMEA